MTTIEAKKDLYNGGKCFTKGNEYEVRKDISKTYELIDTSVINDLGQPHLIGMWYRDFEIKLKEVDE